MGNILLTGAAGFIGARTAELLLEGGHTVVGIDNLNDYYDVSLKEYRLDRLNTIKGFKFHKIDIESLADLTRIFDENKFDAVINLAARAGVRYSLENPHIYITTNVHGSLNLLECMREFGVNKYILASTSSLYAGQPMPFSETLSVNEPISPYAASKKSSEMLAYTYHKLFGFQINILRYFTVYGPAGRPDMSPFRFIKWTMEEEPIKVFGDGSQSRDFTYVDDVARATVDALALDAGYSLINIGGGNSPVSLNSIIEMIEAYLGKNAEVINQSVNLADMKETWADISVANQLLSWKPEISVEEGFKRTVEWHMENEKWLRDIKV